MAYAVFFAVPLVLWVAIAGLSQRGQANKLRSVVSGHDGRLSLSRLQAFAWTMVIIGSYCAAMVIHPRIEIASTTEVQNRKAAYDAALAKLKTASDALDAAEIELIGARTAPNAGSADGAKAIADKTASRDTKRQVRDLRQSQADAAKLRWEATQWVQIPNPLLALAGIAIGSGVFASVIAASSDKGKDPFIEQIGLFPGGAGAPPGAGSHWLRIIGGNFGKDKPAVRLNGAYVDVLGSNDTAIAVDADDKTVYKEIAVDSSNGKIAFTLTGGAGELKLGEQIIKSEWSDLFRDDASPDQISLMKVQMFAWTLIAILIYIYVFWTNAGTSVDSLPVVDPTLVILTGLSQSGYLGAKGASTLNKS